jgi:L-alanine-DL-glutamate epimerase-like enolase superfamily enzyme
MIQTSVKRLLLTHPFGIARGIKTHVDCVFVALTADGYTGYGEASPNARYGETPENVKEIIEAAARVWPWAHHHDYAVIDAFLEQHFGGNLQAGRAALDMAWWDWFGKKNNLPLQTIWNAPTSLGPVSSFTIGLDSEEIILKKLDEAASFPVLKVKLGASNDDEIMRLVRKHTSKTIRVDANEGWKDLQTAKARISILADLGVEFVEQPMPANCISEMIALKKWSPLPLIADESLSGKVDLDSIATQFHGINIKLMKCGGPGPAMRLMAQARRKGLYVLIGCMIESSLANSAAGVVSLWADYADIDGFKLISNDPCTGLEWTQDARIALKNTPGFGVHWNQAF